MKNKLLLFAMMLIASHNAFAQGAKSIKINEVMTHNKSSIQDEFGDNNAWVELCNVSHSTQNIRGMYIATDKAVLNKSLSAPERQKMMSIIPSNDPRTVITARQHIVFFLNSASNKGTLHLDRKTASGKPLWIAIYDGNGVDLLDSITVPALKENEAYARVKDGSTTWRICDSTLVTPNTANTPYFNNKIKDTKENDPHGFAITILAMGTTFSCLLLLFIFFKILGFIMRNFTTGKKIAYKHPFKPVTKTVQKVDDVIDTSAIILKDGLKTKGIDKKVYIAVIAMALKQYQDDVHDVESGVITIKPKKTSWKHYVNATSESPILKK